MPLRPTSKWVHEQQAKIVHLDQHVIELNRRNTVLRQELDGAVVEKEAAIKGGHDLLKQFGDLKERLHKAEIENSKLRGYIERVLEDDTANEDLVKVGEPDGAERLVPKRVSTILRGGVGLTRYDCDDIEDHIRHSGALMGHMENRPRRPSHWIRYGESE